MKKELSLVEVINIVTWANKLGEDKLGKLDFKILWNLKKVNGKFAVEAQEFEDMRKEELQKIQDKYFNDERSHEYSEPILDAEGNEVKDENGVVQTRMMRKVNDEFMDEYRADIDELNKKIEEVLMEKSTYEYNSSNIDEFVENIDNPEPLTFHDLEMLDAFLGDNAE